MKPIRQISTMLLAIALLAARPAVTAADAGACTGGVTPPAVSSLDAGDISNLAYLREEEKLARDLNRALYELWRIPVFERISAVEQLHTGLLEELLARFGLPDPVIDDATGQFADEELGTRFDSLVAEGTRSPLDALHVAAAIEEIDMINLLRATEQTDNAAIASVYEGLLIGARNQLRASVAHIGSLGVAYRAQYLPQAEVDRIVRTPVEPCHWTVRMAHIDRGAHPREMPR